VFCGNFEYDAPERAILDLFEKYGPVHRIDMKTGEPLDGKCGQDAG
jgi:arginine/serine-rich splicing factor 4/5/6